MQVKYRQSVQSSTLFLEMIFLLYLLFMSDIVPGTLLISDPFLKDPNFMRTVVLICEHNDQGSFGFVLNKDIGFALEELVDTADGIRFPVFEGGPVQKDTLHFIHQCPALITGGQEVGAGIYWGGDFPEVLELLRTRKLQQQDIRFFVGYSGWSEGQLEGELEEKSWITRPANPELVFRMQAPQIWKAALQELGGEYKQMTNYPIDPQLN
jgi:putative transcriptional regulator